MAVGFIAIWIVVGITIFLIALGGGPRRARAQLLALRSRPARRVFVIVLAALYLGLGIAIPAVVIYNMFARSIAGYRALLGDASAEILRLTSRDLDRRGAVRAAIPTAAE